MSAGIDATTGDSREETQGVVSVQSVSPRIPGEDFVLTLWTDDPLLARAADAAGVDRIGVDLETQGKRERQAGLGTWISTHRTGALRELRSVLVRARLFARVNPLHDDTPGEVERLLDLGVGVLMLPMFNTAEEIARFSGIVDGRATVVPLLETARAAEDVARICGVPGLCEIHVGINDLALSLGMKNRFEVLDSELIERVSAAVRDAGLRFGIGGIGRVQDAGLPIPPDLIYAQHARLGARAALLSRAFIHPGTTAAELRAEVLASRARLAHWCTATEAELQEARRALRAAVERSAIW
jgi:citrate lyase beta subunit